MKISTLTALFGCVVGIGHAATLAKRDDPHEPNTASDCFQWIQAIAGDDCNSLAEADNVKIDSFLLWNPTLAKDCKAVKAGYYYCTGSHETPSGGGGPTTTTPVTPPTPTPTLDVGQFPPENGVLQCVSPGKPIPKPALIAAGHPLLASINTACTKIVGKDAMWLEKGYPYPATVKVGDHDTGFALQIKLGGFSVTNAFCVQRLKAVLDGCTTGNQQTYGGCAYTSDKNLLACVLP